MKLGSTPRVRHLTMALASATAAIGFNGFLSASQGEVNMQAPAGETRFWVEEVASDLDRPWEMTWLPNGDMLLTERPGRLRIVQYGKLLPNVVTGMPEVLSTSMFDGLLEVKADPDFASNGMLYLTYTTGEDNARVGHIMKAHYVNGALTDQKVIFTTAVPAPAGGPNIMRILFLPDKTMFVGMGSGGQGSRAMVQRLDNQAGKIIHLNRDGSAVADGPIAKTEGALPEIWAVGFRNPAGIARTTDGEIWAIDIGPKGGDELNLVKPGGNYGWPQATWGFDYSGRAMSEQQDGGDYVDPIANWGPSRAPSSLIQYTGDRFPEWKGDLFTGELMGHVIRRIRVKGGKVVLEEALIGDFNERIRTVAQGPDGYIYALTDSSSGRLLRLRPGAPTALDKAKIAKPSAVPTDAGLFGDLANRGVYQEKFSQIMNNFKYDETRAKKLFGQNCAACHNAGAFQSGEMGPDLNTVYFRKSGTLPGYTYSAPMANPKTQVTWDGYSLQAFIANPQSYYPGTKMAVPPINDTEVVLQLDAYLKSLSQP
ncbi:hypothetical protein BH11PSE5_BH11PSE5_17050 [soil metagenome]